MCACVLVERGEEEGMMWVTEEGERERESIVIMLCGQDQLSRTIKCS